MRTVAELDDVRYAQDVCVFRSKSSSRQTRQDAHDNKEAICGAAQVGADQRNKTKADFTANSFRNDAVMVTEFFERFAGGRFEILRQPISPHLQADEVLYDECLLRLLDFDGDSTSFGKYARSLEKTGLIRAVDASIMLLVIKALRSEPGICLGVNVSARSAC